MYVVPETVLLWGERRQSPGGENLLTEKEEAEC